MIAWRLGKKTWSVSTINSILCNEKYKGDALLQKTFTVDFLSKTTKSNEGEIPQYYVTGNHEPIIAPAVWDQVQHELARRSGRSRSFSHPFASKIECGCCGGWYGPKTWHAGSRYERRIWRCNRKYDPARRPAMRNQARNRRRADCRVRAGPQSARTTAQPRGTRSCPRPAR
ncbi:MAG: recombinase family protein [Rothia mucilaginosa]|nr:recombinase family protein [Rothia mucilaginosa]